MGVHGLWKLIEPAGKQVPLESLENKVLAVDVSIWLYQVTKGMQTTGGGTIPNAHLLGLFNRICKLLYYRIKPVFVFDGGVPLLKKETIEARKRSKRKAQDNSEQLREKLLNNYLKQKAIHDYLGNDDAFTSIQIIDDLYALPPLPEDEERIDDPDSSDNETEVNTAKLESFCNFQYGKDLHSIDIHSEQFKALPADIRHEILSEIVETRKQNSWAKVNEMPEDSQDFSKFQLERLKKRRDVQLSLDSAAKEIGGRSMTLNELEVMFKEDGIVTDNLTGQRIVGDNITRFVYVTGKSKGKEPVKDVQKPLGKKEKPGIKEKRAEMEKIFSVCVPEKPSTSSETKFEDKMQKIETKFEDNIQKIEDSIFIKDFSSDEEVEVINETCDSEYIRSLLSKEKLSQEEILNIIKQEKNDDENSSPSMITSEPDDRAAPYTIVVSAEVHKYETLDPNLSQQEIFKTSEKVENGDESSSPSFVTSDTECQPAPRKSIVTTEINDDEIVECSQEFEKSKLSLFFNKSYQVTREKVAVEKTTNIASGSLPYENQVSKSHSIELFVDDAETEEDMDDQFKGVDRCSELAPTQILPKNGDEYFQDELVSEAKSLELFSDTDSDDLIEVSCEEKSAYFKKDDKEIEILIDPREVVENDIFSDVFDVEKANDTVTVDKSLNDTVILDRNLLNEYESFASHGASNFGIECSSNNDDIFHNTNMKSAETIDATKSTEPTKTLASILNKVKKAEKSMEEMKTGVSNDDKQKYKEIQDILSLEQNELLAERGKQERLGSTITQQMIIEVQELLNLFGLPYVVAPMEAEAQCAFLDKISLTEGTITDDSDIWLFGGQKVYKNFFDQKKVVLQFRSVDIAHFFKLSREQLIQMALLVGSDYTVGIEGVGPVTAIEILAYFSDTSEPLSSDDIANTLRKFRNWLKNNRNGTSPLSRKCKDVKLTEAFPNTTVIDAYLNPTVDESKEDFTWATPDLDRIRTYIHSKFGWKTSRIDEILLPVIRRMNDKNKQTTLDMYFKQKPFATIEYGGMSKRVIEAINVMKGKTEELPFQRPSTSKSPRKNPSKTPPKRTRKSAKKTPLKRTPTALPIYITQNSASKRVAAPYFGETIPQKEKDKMEAAKRKLDAIKIFQAQNKNTRNKNIKKKKVLPPKPDSSYLSESSSGEDI